MDIVRDKQSIKGVIYEWLVFTLKIMEFAGRIRWILVYVAGYHKMFKDS